MNTSTSLSSTKTNHRRHRGRNQRTPELEPFQSRKVNVAKFKPELPAARMRALLGLDVNGHGRHVPSFFFPLETLSVRKTVGRGRTNLTCIRPTIVQADAAVPFAGFDRTQSPSRAPAMQMHFEPQAYGITGVSNYTMEFAIEGFGPTTFRLDGSFGLITNASTVTVPAGRRWLTLTFRNVAPADQIFGFIEQTAGERWNWFSAAVRFPIPVLTAATDR